MRAAPAVVGFSSLWLQLLQEPVTTDYSEDTSVFFWERPTLACKR